MTSAAAGAASPIDHEEHTDGHQQFDLERDRDGAVSATTAPAAPVVPAPAMSDPAAVRRAFALFPSGVTAVCAMGPDGPIGMTASSFTSVSLNPVLVSVCFDLGSRTWPQLADRPRIGISVLGSSHTQVGRALAARTGDRFADVRWHAEPDGAVFLQDAPLRLDCRIHQALQAGDHHLVLFEVLDVTVDEQVDPLVWHRSALQPLAV